MLSEMLGLAGALIPAVLVVLAVLLVLVTGYVKASPDTAYIISGLRKQPKVLIGKAGIKIPFLEKKDELNLQLIPIDVKTSSAVPTADYINICVDAAVNVKISDNPERLALAAQNFTNLVKDIVGTFTQVSDGLKESTGVDVQAVLSGFLGGKIARKGTDEGDAAGQLELGKKAEGEA